MRLFEFFDHNKKLVIFDIDDTLVHTTTKILVVKDGKKVGELDGQEFKTYKLKPGESFDFGRFSSAKEFFEKSKPMIPMINQLKHDIDTGNKVIMITAREDFDDKELFLDTFRKLGVDMSKVHVYRAGNMRNKMHIDEKKAIIVKNVLDQGDYNKAIMYDDDVSTLKRFVQLKNDYPIVNFYAWYVSLDGKATEFQRSDRMSRT